MKKVASFELGKEIEKDVFSFLSRANGGMEPQTFGFHRDNMVNKAHYEVHK